MLASRPSAAIGRVLAAIGLVVVVCCAVGAFPATARAASVYVSATGSDIGGDGSAANPYATVQYAIGVAASGDTVEVGPGTFVGDVEMKDGVSLRGAGTALTTLRGTGSATAPSVNAYAIGAGTSISGLAVTGDSAGIQCYNSAVNVTDCVVSSDSDTAIYCFGGSPTITNCIIPHGLYKGIWCVSSSARIEANTISGCGEYGIYCYMAPAPAIRNNVIAGNAGGILCELGSSPDIVDCTITGNKPSSPNSAFSGVCASGGSVANLYGCIVWDNALQLDGKVVRRACVTDADPLFVDAAAADYHLKAGSPCIGKGWQYPGVTLDRDGFLRSSLPAAFPDIGAYEWQAPMGGGFPLPAPAPSVVATVGVGAGPSGIAIDAAGTRAYVTNQTDGTVSVLDLATNTVVDTVGVGSGPRGAAVTPDGARVYVANHDSNSVSVIDAASNVVVATIGVGAGPSGIAIDAAGTRAYVTNQTDGTVSVLDLATNTVVDTVGVGSGPRGAAVTPDGARVYVANHDSNSVSVIDAASNVVVATITAGEEPPQEGQSGLGYGPSGIAIDAAGTCAYVTNQTDGTVSVLDLATNTVIDTILVGGAPGAIAVNPGTSRVAVAVADGANSCVPLIDCATNEVADTVQTAGADPSALACNHDTSRLYVTDFGTDAVEVIQDVPSVATFTPLVGSSGTTVTITGAGFTGTPTIAFNGTSATSCTVESPTRIAVAVPAGATPGKISVTTPSGTATSTADFAVTYALSYAAGPGGSIDGSATQVVGYGASGTAVTAVPDPGYSFVSWDDLFLAPTRTDGPVGADASRTAKFACDYEYSLDGDNATITRYVGTGTSVAVPATLDGHPVVAIGMLAFAARSDLTGVTLPNSLNSIEAGAFDGCTGLTNIGIPAGVTSIGSRAFAFCRGLTAVTLPAGLTSIGDSTFESCESLRGIEIPSGVTSIGSRAFGDCSGVLSLRIGESVATIGDLAFDGCSALREVIVPPAVTSIGYRAFSRCTSMTMLDFTDWGSPGSLSIGESAFQGCTSLASTITVPARVDSIGAGAFTNCANLASVAFIGNAPGTVGAGIFSGTASGFVVTRLYLASGFGPKPPGPWVPTGNPAEGSYTTAYIDPRPTHSITSSAMADGKYLSKWDESRAGGEPVESYLPAGIAVAPSGDVYVADTQNHRIQYFDSTGAYKGQWGSHGSGQGQFDQPVDMALAPDGDVYVADTKNHRIQYFGATGGYKGTFGVEGSGEGQFKAPAGIGVAPNGCVYVADAELNRVQYFDATGVYKGTFGVQGSGDGELSMPVGLAVAPNGDVYVGDWGNGRIQYFGPTGVYKGAWGSDGSGEGQFSQPAFMDIDSGGNVYVPDVFNNRIQYFSATGTYLGQWGTEGSGDEKWPGGFGQPDR